MDACASLSEHLSCTTSKFSRLSQNTVAMYTILTYAQSSLNLGGSRTCFCSAPPLKEAFLASWSEKRPLPLSDPKGQVSPRRGNAGQASDMTQQTLLLAYRPSVCVANHCLFLGRGVGRKTHGYSWGITGRFAGLLNQIQYLLTYI